ncbi:Pectin lyase fold/virulence factor [Pseudocohnilembus persalinus]|uniref:Pectin lyase fold/virulence factor n=1 Tax=Pseudocohnilembus persalinus TaxID=266149 RepID=A0A0V0QTD8_PSEPJ|nr:Pectin lyase fold/virulence factor [Pseudocohnilembus persalinus]|eukprot:KRX05518.1 Pectin lyase fold/virulence factor [Pseudocohnilembus persalinus]
MIDGQISEIRSENKTINVEVKGVIADQNDIDTCNANTKIINQIFISLQPGETVFFPNKTFWFNGGIYGKDLTNNTIQIDGTIYFQDNQYAWPRQKDSDKVQECILFENIEDIIFTSSGTGTIDGNGAAWWGYISYLKIAENRPRLIRINDSARMLFENILLKDSPYWTFYAYDVIDLEIRHSQIYVNRANGTTHDLDELGAFNTDGFDVAGKNIWIHDCTVWNDDDCVCVKELHSGNKRAQCSENMLFEDINASGVGLTVGSIGPNKLHTCVKNITFQNIYMDKTFKGIYMKSRPGEGTGEISDVLYKNITMFQPTQWPIWIGPQQASYEGACSLLWPQLQYLGAKCPVPGNMNWSDITLQDITVKNNSYKPGVILGNSTNPMKNIVFDNVIFEQETEKQYQSCKGVQNGIYKGNTNPVPKCFKQG